MKLGRLTAIVWRLATAEGRPASGGAEKSESYGSDGSQRTP